MNVNMNDVSLKAIGNDSIHSVHYSNIFFTEISFF